ncbi:ribonuclease H-like domain-containing protein [Tanacetum coccineum]
MAKRSTVVLDEDDEEEEQNRQCSRWTGEEEILLCQCWIENSENNDIGADQSEDSFWGQIMQDFNNGTYQGSSGGSASESISEDLRRKLQATSTAYETKKEKELEYTECKKLEFLMIDLQQPTPTMVYTSQFTQPHLGQGVLDPAPTHYASQATSLPSAFNTMTLQDLTWHMDTGASSHLNFNASNLSTIFYKRLFPSVHVGDDNSIPVTNTGHSIIPSIHRPIHLYNVLVTPNIIKNLIFVRQFTRDNNYTIEFDVFGFSVKDFLTRHILLRCDSPGDLYPVTKPSTTPTAFLSTSTSTWHQRLGHPGDEVLRSLVSHQFISCNKEKSPHICRACQLGKHVKLPFHRSDSIVEHCFDIIHSDLWTSPIERIEMTKRSKNDQKSTRNGKKSKSQEQDPLLLPGSYTFCTNQQPTRGHFPIGPHGFYSQTTSLVHPPAYPSPFPTYPALITHAHLAITQPETPSMAEMVYKNQWKARIAWEACTHTTSTSEDKRDLLGLV